MIGKFMIISISIFFKNFFEFWKIFIKNMTSITFYWSFFWSSCASSSKHLARNASY